MAFSLCWYLLFELRWVRVWHTISYVHVYGLGASTSWDGQPVFAKSDPATNAVLLPGISHPDQSSECHLSIHHLQAFGRILLLPDVGSISSTWLGPTNVATTFEKQPLAHVFDHSFCREAEFPSPVHFQEFVDPSKSSLPSGKGH